MSEATCGEASQPGYRFAHPGYLPSAVWLALPFVMPGLVPGIHVLITASTKDVDARDKRGHDAGVFRSVGT